MNVYQIPKLTQDITIDAQWSKTSWIEVPPLEINQHCWGQPPFFPRVQAKLAYDTAALYVIFQVNDRYVRAVAENYQDEVYKDSCVEFFFTAADEDSQKNSNQGYFNLEVNCGGTALFHHQQGREIEDVPVSETDFKKMQIAHTLPKVVDPEIEEAITWVVEYRLPFSILSAYAPVSKPMHGTKWRANLYKCADESSHPHWLTWSRIDTPTPDFHRPEFFGRLVYD